MATITDATFDTVLDTVTTVAPVEKGEDFRVQISGTYAMVIQLQREVGALNSGAWETIKEYSTANATIDDLFVVDVDAARYRCFLKTDTSGSASITLSDSDQEMFVARDPQGNIMFTVTQAGITFPGTLTVDGAATITGALTQTGAASLASTLAVTGIVTANAENALDNVKAGEFQTLDPGQKLVFMDDFMAPISTKWSTAGAGSGAGTQVLTVVANGIGGEATMESSTADAGHDANFTGVSMDALHFKANQGNLVIEARLKIDDVANGAYIFVGFTDVIDTTSEAPLFFTADAIDSDAANAAGVLYDFDSTTDEWAQGGVKANTDTAPTFAGSLPVVNTYVTVRVEIDSAGAVIGYIDGVAIGAATAAAITVTTALTPTVIVGNRSANQVIMTLDYIYVSQDR